MDATTLTLAIAALVTTLAAGLGGAWIAGLFAERQARRTQLRDQQLAVYTEAAGVAESMERMVADLTSPHVDEKFHHTPPEVMRKSLIAARVPVAAPAAVRVAWAEFEAAGTAFAIHLHGVEQAGRAPITFVVGMVALPADDPRVVRLTVAIAGLREAMRQAVGNDG